MHNVDAHDVWIEPQNQGFSVLVGHQKSVEPYSPDKVKDIKAFISKGLLPVYLKPQETQLDFTVEGKPVLITLYFDNGFWSKSPDGKWLNLPKTAVSNPQKTTHAHKFAKTVLRWEEMTFSPINQLLEIVPKKKEHNELVVQVLFEGNPLSNVSVYYDLADQGKESSVKTDEQGFAKIVLTHKGKQFVTVEHKLKTAEVETDENSWVTNLVFFEP
jgi:nickel transport protein